jgi:sugar lactone lactonase YvrE
MDFVQVCICLFGGFCMFYALCLIFFGLMLRNGPRIFFSECEIMNTIENIQYPEGIIQTPCGKFLIGIEKHSIFRYNLETKQKVRIAGSVDQFGHQDDTRNEARFKSPTSLTLSKDLKTLFVADLGNYVIRAICIVTGVTTTFAGQVGKRNCVDGSKEKACFEYLKGLKLSPDGNTLIVADDSNIRTICIATGQVNTICIFDICIYDFTLSPDGNHVTICHWTQILKYNIETGKSEIVSEEKGLEACGILNNEQLLFISYLDNCIEVVNFDTNKVIDTITTRFEPQKMSISTNGKQLYVNDHDNDEIQVLDISKYCTNFKTFLQSQLSKHSFLPQQVIKIFN